MTSEICLPEIPPVHPQAGQAGGSPAAVAAAVSGWASAEDVACEMEGI